MPRMGALSDDDDVDDDENIQKRLTKKEVRAVTARDLREKKTNPDETGHREAVRSIVECKSHRENVPDSTVTLPRPRNAGNN